MLSLSEYIMQEPLPLAVLHEAILDFCRGREDVCVFGAQALSRHTGVRRMTQNVDIMAEQPETCAHDLAKYLTSRYPHQMAARVRVIRRDDRVLGYRVYQQRSEERGGNRHLADIRILDVPRAALSVENGITYTSSKLTLAMKAIAATVRTNSLKRDQDRIDVRRLLLAMPSITAADLEPLWQALHTPAAVRDTFEQLRLSIASSAETEADDFY